VVTDITEHPAREGKVYCAVFLDACSRRVVGWFIDSSQTAALATNALDMAICNLAAEPGMVIHWDHGCNILPGRSPTGPAPHATAHDGGQ
jgi:putative transposase